MDNEMRTHLKVQQKLQDLDELRPKVIIGFAIFWSLLVIAFITTIMYYWVL